LVVARLARGDSGTPDASRVGPARTHARTRMHAHARTMQSRVRTHHSLCHCDCLCGACMWDSVSVKHLPPPISTHPHTHPPHPPHAHTHFRSGGDALHSPAPLTLGCQRLCCAGAACLAMRTCSACCAPAAETASRADRCEPVGLRPPSPPHPIRTRPPLCARASPLSTRALHQPRAGRTDKGRQFSRGAGEGY
jgi:hypothetical protein